MSQLSYEPKAQITLITPNGRRILSGELSRYLVVSAVALAADVGLLSLLSAGFGAPYLIANPIAFAMGAMIAYFGSVHWAFRNRKLSNRGVELLIFVAIGVGGLAVNESVLWLGIEMAALSLIMANWPPPRPRSALISWSAK
jgi:putative flippase GtrA